MDLILLIIFLQTWFLTVEFLPKWEIMIDLPNGSPSQLGEIDLVLAEFIYSNKVKWSLSTAIVTNKSGCNRMTAFYVSVVM